MHDRDGLTLVEYGQTVRARQQTARELDAYLASGDGGTSRALRDAWKLGEAVSSLLQDLMDKESGADISLDGIAPVAVTQESTAR